MTGLRAKVYGAVCAISGPEDTPPILIFIPLQQFNSGGEMRVLAGGGGRGEHVGLEKFVAVYNMKYWKDEVRVPELLHLLRDCQLANHLLRLGLGVHPDPHLLRPGSQFHHPHFFSIGGCPRLPLPGLSQPQTPPRHHFVSSLITTAPPLTRVVGGSRSQKHR